MGHWSNAINNINMSDEIIWDIIHFFVELGIYLIANFMFCSCWRRIYFFVLVAPAPRHSCTVSMCSLLEQCKLWINFARALALRLCPADIMRCSPSARCRHDARPAWGFKSNKTSWCVAPPSVHWGSTCGFLRIDSPSSKGNRETRLFWV